MNWNSHLSSRGALLLLVLISSVLFSRDGRAQSLDVRVDSMVSSGILTGPGGEKTETTLAPLALELDAAFVFDGDDSIEWVLGTISQVEDTPGFAVNPQIRLRREYGHLAIFAGFGLPLFFKPFTRLGTEFSLGFAFPERGALSLFAQGQVASYLFGSDLPDDAVVLTIGGAVGLRWRF